MRGKIVSETTNFGWVWPGDSLFQSDCSILESSTLCAEGLTPVSMGIPPTFSTFFPINIYF